MNAERWQQIDELLQSALARSPEERSAFLARACAEDELLRSEVESLIASHEDASNFLETPMSQIAAELLVNGQGGLAVGQQIGPYKIMGPLGAGGMGEVYLAEDPRLGRKIALKLLPDYFTRDANRLRRFEQEARAASSLNHPNIVTIYEIGKADGHHFIASEFIEGVTLREHITSPRIAPDGSPSTALKLGEILDLAVQIGEALAAAHAAGIVHRDIKPENIMVRPDAYLKVLDFGLAKLTERPAFANDANDAKGATLALLKTNPGIVMGTVTYMSPEQARGLPVDARTDIWSLGVVLYEMVTGRLPFEGETTTDVILSIVEREPAPLARYSKDTPAELERIVSKALRKNKEERYQTAKDLALDLKNLKQELEVQARLEGSNGSEAGRGQSAVAVGEQMGIVNGPKPAARMAGEGTIQPSSVAHIVSEIKSHKRSLLLGVAVLVIVVGAVVYFSYLANSGETIDSIAVLPFVNVSNNADTEYLSDGLSDSIIDSLSQLPNLKKVSAFSSVLRYKGQQIDPQTVGRELNVGAVLTGRLVQRGEDLLIIAELVDVKDNKRLWGGQYNRKSADILNLQGEIAREISEKLRPKLTGEEKERLNKRQTENAEAYQLYLQGRYYWHKFTDEALIKSGEYFQRAIEKDPNYALAYAGLADSYAAMAFFGQIPPKQAWPKSEEAAVKALAIDDGLGEAHFALAVVKTWYDWNWPGGEREFKRAIELNPEFAGAESHAMYASLLDAMGRFDEAIAEAKRSREVDPLSTHYRADVRHILYHARRYDEATEEYRKGLEKNPDSIEAHLGLGEVYVKQGRYEEALAEMLKARPLVKSPRQLARIGSVYAAAGKRDEAIKTLEEVKGLTGERYDLGVHIAAIYAALGNKDQAFAWLDNAYEAHAFVLIELKVDPKFDTLRSDPRFADLLGRMRLAA
jgi:serine/threonine protein kinase/TolA-binding protein